jgi:hypothetical protein
MFLFIRFDLFSNSSFSFPNPHRFDGDKRLKKEEYHRGGQGPAQSQAGGLQHSQRVIRDAQASSLLCEFNIVTNKIVVVLFSSYNIFIDNLGKIMLND